MKYYPMLPSIRRSRGRTYNLLKSSYTLSLRMRQIVPMLRPLDNLYLASIQKTGSQWLRSVLSDARVRERSRLRPYPQRRYEWGEFVRRYPLGTFVPGLYVSYDLYEEIAKPARYRTIYVLRDPRDVVVSWYWSMLESHVQMGKVQKYRTDLSHGDLREGLHYCIDALTLKFAQIRTWVTNSSDPNVLIVRFEDLTANSATSLSQVFAFCGFQIEEKAVANIADRYSKERMRFRDLQNRSGEVSHYRRKSSRHEELFEPDHHDHFRDVTGNLVELLGYES